MVIEGYIDPAGYTDQEGPFGEYMGYYGPMHDDPVFHVTAITHRHDVLHQSVLHGMGHKLAGCESTVMGALRNETQAMDLLRSAGIQPTAIHCKSAAAVGHHMRVAIRQTAPGQARAAIAVLLGNMQVVKHVFVVDEDIDVCSDDQMEWAFSTRFQADRDLTTMSGMREMFMDPSTEKRGIGTKAGFDLTFPFPRPEAVTSRAAVAPRIGGAARFQSVRQALESGPMHFATLMAAVGSRDGRELVLDIEELRSEGILYRLPDGEYALRSPARTD
jgi:3-polyprenyl-4-hydroxybenzoate decarboxylase